MSNYGETLARSVDGRIAQSPATQAALVAIPYVNRVDAQVCTVEADQTQWQFVLGSTQTPTPGVCLAPTDGLGGRWLAVGLASTATAAGTLMVPLLGAILAAGTPMAAFADSASSAPGVTLDNITTVGVRWNDAATQVAIWTEVDLPTDLDPTYPIIANVLMSKSGATVGDAVTWDISCFAQTVAALEDAGSNLGGTTPALSSAQAVLPALTITQLQLPVYLPPTPPARLSVSIKPTNGTLGTDDAVLNGFYFTYTKRPAVARVLIDMRAAILAAGTPMAAFANNAGASAPGITLDNSKAVGVRWNNQATLTAVWSSFDLPLDADVTKPMVFVVLASKSGATVGDATTFDIAAYEQIPGTAEDAGPSVTGTTSALTGNATAKTVAKLTLGVAPNTFTASPARVSVSIKPTDALLGTDDAIVNGFWVEYTRVAGTPNVPRLAIDMHAAILAAGTPMAAFANNAGASAPGITLDNSKAVGVRWNNFATQTKVWSYVEVPLDLDVTKTVIVNVLASKSGATLADATTFDVGVFEQTVGALENAGANLGGTTSALVGNATAKKVSLLTYTIPANTLTAGPGRLSISVKPTDGTLTTDDVIINGFWLQYAHL